MTETANNNEFSHFFKVNLNLFRGPIDLLLHLVKSNELEITKISLADVTGQYMNCLENMQKIDLDIAGEYLVIAATLLSIKSCVLLNKPVELIEDEDGNLVDPHEELLRKIREAEIYKEGAYHLSHRDILGVDVFAPPSLLKTIVAPPEKYAEHDPLLLGKAFRKILDKLGSEAALYTITVDSVTIVERMMRVVDILKSFNGSVVFDKLIDDITSRPAVIGTFIALLELCKRQVISVKQDQSFDEIRIALADGHQEFRDFDSEFDVLDNPEEKVANA